MGHLFDPFALALLGPVFIDLEGHEIIIFECHNHNVNLILFEFAEGVKAPNGILLLGYEIMADKYHLKAVLPVDMFGTFVFLAPVKLSTILECKLILEGWG